MTRLSQALGAASIGVIVGACASVDSATGPGGKTEGIEGTSTAHDPTDVSCQVQEAPTWEEAERAWKLRRQMDARYNGSVADMRAAMEVTRQECWTFCRERAEYFYPRLCWRTYTDEGCDVRCSDDKVEYLESTNQGCPSKEDYDGRGSCGIYCTLVDGSGVFELPWQHRLHSTCYWPGYTLGELNPGQVTR